MHVDWENVKRVLVVRLRSIGDTVLVTPSLISLRRFLPNVRIDILLEDWVAPILEGFDAIDNIISVGSSSTERLKTGRLIRRNKYDVVFNLHGGTTATFFTRASGARHRVGYAYYQYNFLHNHLLTSSADYWHRENTHSAEQQLALLGFVGVPVHDLPKTRLVATEQALKSLEAKFKAKTQSGSVGTDCGSGWLNTVKYALLHPASSFFTKQWATENFARTAEFLAEKGFQTVAVASKNESRVLDDLKRESVVPVITFDDLTLPEITALASKASIFVGNDSGIAHIAAAVQTPTVVIFGSSNRNHWCPWTDAPNEIVFEEFGCQPCPGYECAEFGEPRCILSVPTNAVIKAIKNVMES